MLVTSKEPWCILPSAKPFKLKLLDMLSSADLLYKQIVNCRDSMRWRYPSILNPACSFLLDFPPIWNNGKSETLQFREAVPEVLSAKNLEVLARKTCDIELLNLFEGVVIIHDSNGPRLHESVLRPLHLQ